MTTEVKGVKVLLSKVYDKVMFAPCTNGDIVIVTETF